MHIAFHPTHTIAKWVVMSKLVNLGEARNAPGKWHSETQGFSCNTVKSARDFCW